MEAGSADVSDPPETVGRYRLTRRIGQGSFATVWRGRDDDLDVEVAVKVLSPQWAADDDVRQRFVTEARLMRRINDARITHVYDIGQVEDGRPYFVMDFADSGSLNDVRRSRPSPVRALRLCAETCRAIAVLHEYDIVHRDVTPGNVLLTRGRGSGVRVMIADLGVANDRAAAIGLPMTAGTPGYMPPEQARGEHVDARADIYALAALCYAMLAGRPPFGARTLDDVLGRDPDQRPEPIAARVDAPEMLDALLAAGLSADPKLRPPTAGLLGEALDRIADDVATRVAARAAAEGGVAAAGEPGTGAGYDGVGEDGVGYDAMATMIRPAGVVGPTRAESRGRLARLRTRLAPDSEADSEAAEGTDRPAAAAVADAGRADGAAPPAGSPESVARADARTERGDSA